MLVSIVLSMTSTILVKNNKNSWEIGLISLLMTSMLVMAVYPLMDTLCLLSKNYMLDSMSLLMIVLSMWITSLMLLASYKLKKTKPKNFMATVIMLLSILMLCFMTKNLLSFYILFEASLLPTTALIILWGVQPERKMASLYIMLYTATASLPMLMMIMSLSMKNNHTNLLMTGFTLPPTINQTMSWMMLMMVFMVKLPLFSLHMWLPKAHVEAPVAGSMVLAAILLKLGGYGIMRMNKLIPQQLSYKSYTIISIATMGAIIMNMMCLRQTDLKALIAYSSVGHMALLIMSTLSNSKLGQYSSLLIMLTHGLTSSCLFFLTNTLYEKMNTRNIMMMSGMMNLLPMNSLAWIINISMNMALPPAMNIISEITTMMSSTIITATMIFLLMVSNLLTTAYSLYIYFMLNHGNHLSLINPIAPMQSITMTCILSHLWPLMVFSILPMKFMFWC